MLARQCGRTAPSQHGRLRLGAHCGGKVPGGIEFINTCLGVPTWRFHRSSWPCSSMVASGTDARSVPWPSRERIRSSGGRSSLPMSGATSTCARDWTTSAGRPSQSGNTRLGLIRTLEPRHWRSSWNNSGSPGRSRKSRSRWHQLASDAEGCRRGPRRRPQRCESVQNLPTRPPRMLPDDPCRPLSDPRGWTGPL